MMDKNTPKREGFSTGLAVFFATLSSTVGLGNIWKFPYLTGKYGGGAFLLVYLVCVVFVAMPVMVSELFIGRRTGKNPVGALKALSKGRFFRLIGYAGMISAFFILFYYSAVAGWIYSYIFKALGGSFTHADYNRMKEMYTATVTGPASPVLWQIGAIAIVSCILILGVKKGIERITKILMPILLVLIVICDIRAMTLPGAMDGFRFIFKVDFTVLTKEVFLMALGLAFFKLSLGMGTIITYGSYFTKDNNMIATSGKVILSDTIVSLLAGIAIFPAVFSFGMQPGQGPGLLFMTVPQVFSKIPYGTVLTASFFILTAIAATMAMVSIFEVVVAYITEEKKVHRTIAVLSTAAVVLLFGIPATLSSNDVSLLSNIRILNYTFFDFYDLVSQNILLPLGGLLIAIFTGFFIKTRDIQDELSNHGSLNIQWLIQIYLFILKFITPVLLVLVFLSMTGIIG